MEESRGFFPPEEDLLLKEEQRLAAIYAKSQAEYAARATMINTWKIRSWQNCRIIIRYLSTLRWRLTIQRIEDGDVLRIHDMDTLADAIRCLHEYLAEIIRSGVDSIDIQIRKGML